MEEGELLEFEQDDPPFAALPPMDEVEALEQRRQEAVRRMREQTELRFQMQQFRDQRAQYLEREERRRQLQQQVEALEELAEDRERQLRLERAYQVQAEEQDHDLRLQQAREVLRQLEDSEDEEADEAGPPQEQQQEEGVLNATRRALKRSAESGATEYISNHWSAWSEEERRRDLQATSDFIDRLPQGRSDEARTMRGSLHLIKNARADLMEAGCAIQQLVPPEQARPIITRLDSGNNCEYFKSLYLNWRNLNG